MLFPNLQIEEPIVLAIKLSLPHTSSVVLEKSTLFHIHYCQNMGYIRFMI